MMFLKLLYCGWRMILNCQSGLTFQSSLNQMGFLDLVDTLNCRFDHRPHQVSEGDKVTRNMIDIFVE